MRYQTCIKIGGVIVLIGLLAACGGDGSYSGSTPAKPGSLESKFGAAFAAIFDASPTSQPVVPTSASVPALAPAGTPINT
jgi:hypothetical protein